MITTVIGSRGFIGRHVLKRICALGEEYFAPERDDQSVYKNHLGHVIYCAGVTSDFRGRPFDTVRAHVSYLTELLAKAQFESFLYLSSTRVYFHQPNDSFGDEESILSVSPQHPEELFSLSKLTGESLCLTVDRPNVRIARLSNVCGDDFASNNFIYSIIKDAVHHRKIILQSNLDSEKDYISVADAADLLIRVSREGKSKIYNVASGINMSNREWVEKISQITGCSVEVAPGARTIKFPPMNINKLREEFQFVPRNSLEMVDDLVNQYLSEMRG